MSCSTYLIDPDSRTYAKHLKKLAPAGSSGPRTVKDVREALEDKNLDAISIATPNHWHALMTVWGCQAGKDVYVEKPVISSGRRGRDRIALVGCRVLVCRLSGQGYPAEGQRGWTRTRVKDECRNRRSSTENVQ